MTLEPANRTRYHQRFRSNPTFTTRPRRAFLSTMAWRSCFFIALFMSTAVAPTALWAQDALAEAKALYSSAAYEEALAMLDRLEDGRLEDVGIEVSLYRMFCLLVLDRIDEAEAVILELVTADPFFVPTTDQASPRIRSMFGDRRRALIPSIAWRMYADARAGFDRKDPGVAERFDRIVRLLDEPGLTTDSTVADLRILAAGFRDLVNAAAEGAPATAR